MAWLYRAFNANPAFEGISRPAMAVVLISISWSRSERARAIERASIYDWSAGGPRWKPTRRTRVDRFVLRHLGRVAARSPSPGLEVRVRALYDYAFEFLPTARLSDPSFLSDESLTWFAFQYPVIANAEQSVAMRAYFISLCEDLQDVWDATLPESVRDTIAARVSSSFAFLPLLFTDRSTRQAALATARWTEHHLTAVHGCLDDGSAADRASWKRSRAHVRVGVIVRDAEPRTESFIAASFAGLPGQCFERVLITFSRLSDGSYGDHLRNRFDRVEVIETDDLADRIDKLRALELDVAIYANTIAAHATPYFHTMAHRIAPVQVLPTAIAPTTTGLASMDVVLTSARTEPSNPQSHYSERVVVMEGEFQCFDFGDIGPSMLPDDPPETPWKERLQALRGPLIAVGGSLYKLSPEFRQTMCRVLRAVPDSNVVLYPFNPNWGVSEADSVRGEIVRELVGLGIEIDRIVVLPALTRAQVVSVLRTANVYLDTFPYTGAASLLDPLAASCPPIVLRGRTQRGLQAASLLASLGLDELIAPDPDAFVGAAVSMLTDPIRRAALVEEIAASWEGAPFLDVDEYGRRLHHVLAPLVKHRCAFGAASPSQHPEGVR